MPQLLFGGMLAIILLGFYIWSIVDAIIIVNCMETLKNTPEAARAALPKCDSFTNNMTYFLNSIGGLISATVVGVLGATKLYEFPGEKLFAKDPDGIVQTIAGYMPSIYILVWMVFGVLTVIFGFGLYETDHIPAFTEHAKAWLGVAVAAGFAYFGINTDGSPLERPAIAKIIIKPETVNLDPQKTTEKLFIVVEDAHGKTIPNLPSDRFAWVSSDPAVATVDRSGMVSRAGTGSCEITAAANGVVSNFSAVKSV